MVMFAKQLPKFEFGKMLVDLDFRKKTMHSGVGMTNHEEFVLSASNARVIAIWRNSGQKMSVQTTQ